MKLGVISDCFKKSMEDSIAAAAALKLSGIQMYAVSGDICPENLTDADIARYCKLLADNDLAVSALCGDLGGGGFAFADRNPAKIEKSKRIIDMAMELETNVVTRTCVKIYLS